MLRQSSTENKALKPDDFARQYADPDRPGFVRRDFWPQPSSIVMEAARRGLRDDRGPMERFLPLPVKPDPTIARRDEAPKALRDAADAAWANLAAIRAKNAAEFDRLVESEQKKQRGGLVVIGRDQTASLESREVEPRREVAAAEAALQEWEKGETFRRSRSTPAAREHAAYCAAHRPDERDATVQTIRPI